MESNPIKLRVCEKEEITFKSRPMGDLRHAADVVLTNPQPVTAEDIIRLIEGKWLYKTLWIGMSVDNLPSVLYLSIHNQRTKNIQREYLMYDPLMPPFMPRRNGSFRAVLTNYGYVFGLLTLPQDTIYFDFVSEGQFTGRLRLLNCEFFRF